MGPVLLKNADPDDFVQLFKADALSIRTPMTLTSWGGRTEIIRSNDRRSSSETRIDLSLVRGLARAHELVRELAMREGAAPSYIRRLSRLAFLSPDIQQAIVDGRQPHGLKLERLMRMDLPLGWQNQRELLGFGTIPTA
jgi:site-specific DNA recombinase